MLGFLISTLGFFVALHYINRYLDAQNIEASAGRKLLVVILATAISIGISWCVDTLDGDANQPHPSASQVIHSGDLLKITKLLLGIS